MPDLVLASTSRYRRQLLERLRVPFAAAAPGVDEDRVKGRGGGALAIVTELALAKALAVAAHRPGAIVIGSDQAACIDGSLLDKPGSAARAVDQLRRLQGRQHELLTAVALVHGDRRIEFVERTALTMRSLANAEIERYVAAEQPFDCAGSYKIEGLGVALFDRIDGGDWTAIQGLPLVRLCAELRGLGIAVP